MASYMIDLRCPRCGKTHRASNNLHLDDGPTEPGSLADLYGSRELPARVAAMLDKQVWCDVAQQWVTQQDRQRVYLMLRRQ